MGVEVGCEEGNPLGLSDGCVVGTEDGCEDGNADGLLKGCNEG